MGYTGSVAMLRQGGADMRHTGFVGITLILTSLAMLVGAAPEAQDQQPATGASKIVNIDLKDAPIKEAIDSIFKDSGLKYEIRPGVSGRVVEMKLAGVTVEQAITALVEAGQLTLKVADGAYVIGPGAKSTASRSGSARDSRTAAAPGEQSVAAEPGGTVPPEGGAADITADQPPSPVYYGHPGAAYGDPYAYDPYYDPRAYPPVYQIGHVRFIGGYPPVVIWGGDQTLLRRVPLPPPAAGYMVPGLVRILRPQWWGQNRIFITFP